MKKIEITDDLKRLIPENLDTGRVKIKKNNLKIYCYFDNEGNIESFECEENIDIQFDQSEIDKAVDQYNEDCESENRNIELMNFNYYR